MALKIILLSENPIFSEPLKKNLEEVSVGRYEIEVVQDPMIALDLDLEKVHAVLFDLNYESIDGINFLQLFSNHAGSCKIIVLNKVHNEYQRLRALQSGGSLYVFIGEEEQALAQSCPKILSLLDPMKEREKLLDYCAPKLINFLRTHQESQATSLLFIHRNKDKGKIWMHYGSIIHAEFEFHLGKDALFEMLGWDQAIISELDFAENEVIMTVGEPIKKLIAEYEALHPPITDSERKTQSLKEVDHSRYYGPNFFIPDDVYMGDKDNLQSLRQVFGDSLIGYCSYEFADKRFASSDLENVDRQKEMIASTVQMVGSLSMQLNAAMFHRMTYHFLSSTWEFIFDPGCIRCAIFENGERSVKERQNFIQWIYGQHS